MECVRLEQLYQMQADGHSSKGNQLKLQSGQYWYKADYMGYEGLAEYIVSGLMEYSNLEHFVRYEAVKIVCGERQYNGCRSAHFLREGDNLITLERLYRQYTGRGLAANLAKIEGVKERIRWLVGIVEELTGVESFGNYLTAMLELDAFFLNEDRHTNNIAVIYNKETDSYRICEYFDHGLSLLSDTMEDFPLGKSVEDCIETIWAKPFSRSFDEQMDAAEELYGQQLICSFGISEVLALLNPVRELYGEKICARVEMLLRLQMRKYSYLFK